MIAINNPDNVLIVEIYFVLESHTNFAPTFQIPNKYDSCVENIRTHEQS